MALAKTHSDELVHSSAASIQNIKVIIRNYFALTKPRIMILLLFTEYCAMIVAQKGFPSIQVTFYGLFGLALSTGGAAALNMWYDSDIDKVMKRTASRPIPSGQVQAMKALWFGIILQTLSFFVLGFLVNWLSSILALIGFVYYVGLYTMWLKRRTPQNIVIGGGAGAFPPLVGWAVVTGQLSLSAILMFLIIFLWTPPHFWALSLYRQDDYKRANIPMMPVVRGDRVTKWQSFLYTILLTGVSAALYFTNTVGFAYLAAAIVLGVTFMVYTWFSLRESADSKIWAKRTFKYSLLYLPTLFIFMVFSVHL